MMNDLDTLRPEVRSALGAMVRADVCRDSVPTDAFDIVRAELLRLATIEADALIALDCEHDWQVEHKRAEKAEAELATAQNTINAQQDTMGALKRKLALSEGELAALKATLKRVRDEMRAWRSRAGFKSGRLSVWAVAIDAAIKQREHGAKATPEPGSLDELRIERGGSSHG